jgi:hypothetical protein
LGFRQHADLINSAFKLEIGKLPLALHDVMVTVGGLQLAAAVAGPKSYHPDLSNNGNGSKATNAAVYFVLRHIAARTIVFGKFFEFVTQKEIVNGMANLAIHPAPVSHFHIKYGLSSMSPPKCVFR